MSSVQPKVEDLTKKPQEAVFMSIEDAIKAGITVRVASDLYVGPATDKADKTQPIKWLRKVEIYKGEPPRGERGKQMVWDIDERCDVQDTDNMGKKFKCEKNLNVIRVKNRKFEWDGVHGGGQLVYDERDIRQYKYCPLHGPFPQGSTSW